MRAASELGLRTVAIYSQEDRFSPDRTKADEAYLVGASRAPVEAYLDIAGILAVARDARVDAIHPGYGFLSENPEFARATREAGLTFIGPEAETMRLLGNKIAARDLAAAAGVAVMSATPALPADLAQCRALARGLGYPVMLKASWGGGGRGTRVVTDDAQLGELLPVSRREALAAFGNDEVYLEKLIERARHVEVQILGDHHGALVHLFERDCTVQRRHQKVVERAPAVFLTGAQRAELTAAALAIGRAARYHNAGTVEFLQDADSGRFYSIEVNPRIQVEHTVTECATGIDLVKAQIRIAEGARIGTPESGVPAQPDIRIGAHALQCRITTEDPENNFIPDYGVIAAYRSPAAFGIRLAPAQLPAGALPTPAPGTKQRLDELGPERFAAWMLAERRVLLTDTTMRDAHQSLLATRLRTIDMTAIAPYYASLLPELFSLECWGGATFDVALRFLREDPWQRLTLLRERLPNLLLQMLLRSANAVGYANYPDNVVRFFVARAAERGIDLFRIFDSLNWVENMRVAIDAVLEAGKLCEASICYSGNLSDPHEKKYTLDYYLKLARELKAAGTHVLGIKDMAGLVRPRAAYALVKALKEEVGLPVHFHTHDTSGIAAASVLAAIDAGADAVDGAIDAMSGLTSQPNLGSIVEALRHGPRDPGVDPARLRLISSYWEQVRRQYAAFESDIRAGASEVYVHGMPGGQYTNLREQARALGIDEARWPEVAGAYAEVNSLFGDIVKVTPTSKAVGDLALLMVTAGLTREQVLDPDVEVAFPESVVEFFRGSLGQPYGGFPPALQRKVLKGAAPLTARPGATLPPVDLAAERARIQERLPRPVTDEDLASYLMYPRVWLEYAQERLLYGDAGILPTPVFFYGMEPGQEISVDLERGKTLIVRYVASSEPHEDGTRTVFFELNGQPRSVRVADRSQAARRPPPRKIEPGNPKHVGAPMPGVVATVKAAVGAQVARGDLLLTLEAMKMETAVRAESDGEVAEVLARPGQAVDAKDLLVVLR